MPLRRRSRGSGGGGVNFEMDPEGVRQLLHSPGIRQDIKARGDRIADAARQHAHVYGDVIVAESTPNVGDRPRVWVRNAHPSAIRVEAIYRVLGAAIDAGGD